ncbi:hypothetical protein GCM10007276_18310 [Agaricicola taiwanensis]|uniref:L-asparaginase N-terminal domain-containing protein n=1 Tax=Agaricicola taiwanensis TaxID=591372 RepID=A0A8J2VV66_9RHOB|nr:asparaginase [Agaricicola taiwanensis]GGE41274.1 hypothetical protein GCM10007276_18310 [Agaricicola taiwanensis]
MVDAEPNKAAIVVMALGGTIAMTDAAAGVSPKLSAAELVAAVPALSGYPNLSARSFRQVPSPHLTFADLEALASAIGDNFREGADGVVITQGTDTIEEAAFALDLLLDANAPVVVTGAMRSPTLAGADGPANLLAAVRTAASAGARGLGVIVTFNDEIHLARHVCKRHTSSTAAFVSPNTGPAGFVAEGRVHIWSRGVGMRPHVEPSPSPREARVALVTLSMDDDGALVALARDAGFDGMVVEASAAGTARHGPPGS